MVDDVNSVQRHGSNINLLGNVAHWASQDPKIRAVALVGSHAHGEADSDSDIDLIVICDNPRELVDDRQWIEMFGEVQSSEIEYWGLVTAIRVFYNIATCGVGCLQNKCRANSD